MRRQLVERFRSELRLLACQARTYRSEPLSRVEMWIGLITLYLVLGAFLMGQFSADTGAALKETVVVPVSNRG